MAKLWTAFGILLKEYCNNGKNILNEQKKNGNKVRKVQTKTKTRNE